MKRFPIILALTILAVAPNITNAGWMLHYENAEGASVVQTEEGGFLVTGSSTVPAIDLLLLETDSSGETLWTRTYGGEGWDWANEIQRTSDGGYIICGGTYSYSGGEDDVWLVKVDYLGEKLWDRNYGGGLTDWGTSVQQTSDNGYIITGGTSSFGIGMDDLWLIKTTEIGDTQWTAAYGNAWDDLGLCVRQTSDGNYIITGYTTNDGNKDLWLLKVNQNGDTLWTKTYGGDNDDMGESVLETSDGYIVGAYGYGGGWLLKTNFSGDTLWTRRYNTGFVGSLDLTKDNGYIITGYMWTLLKTDEMGKEEWFRIYSEVKGTETHQTDDGGYIVVGYEGSSASEYSLWLIKTDSLGYVTVEEPITPVTHQLDWQVTSIGSQIVLRYSDRPQGFSAAIFNVSGQKVDELHSNLTEGTIEWGAGMSAGVYFIREIAENGETQRVVLLK